MDLHQEDQELPRRVRNFTLLYLERVYPNLCLSSHGVTDVNGVDLRCFQMGPASGVATVEAGGTLGFVADQKVTHPGPVQFYMAKVPAGKDISSWDGAGSVWFKAATLGAVLTAGKLDWPHYRKLPRLELC